jgi:hypothetical protein
MSLTELLEVIGGDRSTLRRGLASLKDQDLLDYVASQEGPSAPGRPAGLWSLTDAGKRALKAADSQGSASEATGEDEESHRKVTLVEGQRWVTASVPRGTSVNVALLLAEGELTAAAASVIRLDGEGVDYLFTFDEGVGHQPVENLVSSLEAVGAPCRSGTFRATFTATEFLDFVRTARAAAQRALKYQQPPSR